MKTDSPALCVIGAGPAGLALAMRLAANGQEVTLVDAGGKNVDTTGDDLHGGEVLPAIAAADRTDRQLVGGNLYRANHLMATRFRHPGGSSWRWGARGRPNGPPAVRMVQGAPVDFEARAAFDIPGFPVPAQDILRYQDDVLSFIDLAGHSFDIADYNDGMEEANLPADRFYSKLFHFPKSDTFRKVRTAEAAAHPLIDMRTGLHLVGFERVGHRITAVLFTNDHGEKTRLTPDRIVLSAGGVENSRQLLLGADAGSIPNPHDLLGRYFMDHPHIRLGYLHKADPAELAYYDFQDVRGTPILRGHGIQPSFAESNDMLRFSIDLVGRHPVDGTPTGYAMAAAMDEVRRKNYAGLPRHLARAAMHPLKTLELAKAARGAGVHHTGLGGWSDADARLHSIGVASVESMFEQRPSWDNRIRLGTGTDRYGARQPTLQWSFSQSEVESIRHAAAVTSEAFVAAGLGPLTTMRELGDGVIPRAGTGLHHMGGTRMHSDPTEGVVDEHCRMHELDNLYIAGSSVFPTSVGYANPTFTIMQLAYRLADHLSELPTSHIDLTQKAASSQALQRSEHVAPAPLRAGDL